MIAEINGDVLVVGAGIDSSSSSESKCRGVAVSGSIDFERLFCDELIQLRFGQMRVELTKEGFTSRIAILLFKVEHLTAALTRGLYTKACLLQDGDRRVEVGVGLGLNEFGSVVTGTLLDKLGVIHRSGGFERGLLVGGWGVESELRLLGAGVLHLGKSARGRRGG